MLAIREHELYSGTKKDRVTSQSEAGTAINKIYYGKGNMILEFMEAAVDLFGKNVLLQFEDFNTNDAFPLLAEYRNKFLVYNDDIQGTAAVCVAAVMGSIKLKDPGCTDLIGALREQTFLFHGAGSANLGALSLLVEEAGVSRSKLYVTNSKGIIWKSENGAEGSFKNDEQKEFAMVGKPTFESGNLVKTIEHIKPTCLIGAVGRDPNCFDKSVVSAILGANGSKRPTVFALSNPKTKAEITASDAYTWSNGKLVFGSGTAFDSVVVNGKTHTPGQVNNVYIFPGMSFGAVQCKAKTIPDRLFMVAAEAVANSLDYADLKADRVVPNPSRIRDVSLNVATAVVLEAQKLGIAGKIVGSDKLEVKEALSNAMWCPSL
jgi:malate dehydrogenase (oxaloacetate-decarboxylating)(NADP+)